MSGGVPVKRTDVEQLAFGGIDLDSRVQASRVAVVLYSGGGSAVMAIAPLLSDKANTDALMVAVLAAFLTGWAQLLLPWDRWDPRALVSLVLVADVIIGAGGFFVGGLDARTQYILPLYGLIFAYVGLTQGPAMVFVNVVPSMLSALFLLGGPGDAEALRLSVVAAPTWVVVGIVLAEVSLFRRRAERSIESLLEATREMSVARDEGAGAALLAQLTGDLLEADAVVVMLADDLGSSKFVNVGQSNWVLAPHAVAVDLDEGGGALGDAVRRGEAVFVDDLSAGSRALPAGLQHDSARAGAFLPLPGEGGFFGVVVVVWQIRHGSFDPFARRAAELLSSQAGRAIERIRATARLAVEARTDALTSLANRRQYARALDCVVAGDAVIMLDLDHFKMVNDRHGHSAGDEVLRQLGECLRQISRDQDCVARYGGEEFAIVLAGGGEQGALSALDRLRHLWASTARLTTFSAGVAIHCDMDSAEITLEHADIALYQAKSDGRNCTRVFRARSDATSGWASPTGTATVEVDESDGTFRLS